MSKQSAGGKATALISKQQAQLRKQDYDLNPNLCLHCGLGILSCDRLKLNETKIKKFCDHSCSAKYSNSLRYADRIFYCRDCKKEVDRNKKVCDMCRQNRKESLLKTTKGELFLNCKNWQSARSTIQKHARKTFNASSLEKCCKVCNYDRHFEVCHIKDVSGFSENATISEINSLDNLVALCPTHHWEFDNNYIKF